MLDIDTPWNVRYTPAKSFEVWLQWDRNIYLFIHLFIVFCVGESKGSITTILFEVGSYRTLG